MTDKNENTADNLLSQDREMETTKCAIPAEAKESVGDAINSAVENVEQSDYTAGVERKEAGIDKDIASSSIDAVKDPIGLVKDRKRLKLLDTIAEVQRKYLETEDVSTAFSLCKKMFATLL
jgi:hypothetical protein